MVATMTQSYGTQVHGMKTDPRIIYHFIKSQAGSLGKAVMELAQNSIDAGASRIDITLGQKEFCIEDNGQGFGDAEDIHRNFGTFGTPHEEGDSRFGRFRLGRGQIMAFAKTKWHSTGYVMDVDVQNRGLEYVLTVGPARTGVKVEGTFYTPIDGEAVYAQTYGAELDRAIREFSDLVKYADVAIFLNGKQVNQDPTTVKWDLETEDAYFDFKASGQFRLYNMGFYVRDYPASTYGSAVVVTKTHMKLNMARNSVLENECDLWKRITAVLKTNMVKGPKKGRMDDTMRAFLAKSVRFGEQSLTDLGDLRIITLVTGATVSMENLLNFTYTHKVLSSAPKGHTIGQRVHNEKLAYVVAEETMARFGATTITEFRDTICNILVREYGKGHWLAERWASVQTETIEKSGAAFLSDHIILAQKELNPTEKAALTILNRHNWGVSYKVGNLSGRKVPLRRIVAGESTTMLAWTDGHSYIAFSRSLLNTARYGQGAWTHILHTLVHEYLHEEYDGETTYVHSPEFYETLDRVLTGRATDPRQSLYNYVEVMAIDFLNAMMKNDQKSAALKKKEALKAALEEYEDAE